MRFPVELPAQPLATLVEKYNLPLRNASFEKTGGYRKDEWWPRYHMGQGRLWAQGAGRAEGGSWQVWPPMK